MKQVTQNTEFIIGIDFGHGETSAAFYDLKTQEKKDLNILPGLTVVKSAVAILEQEGKETICVGDAAIINAPFAKDFQISFKKRPSEMTPIERHRMVSFMKGVYAGILNNHPDYKTRNHVVYIARPSQDKFWKSEENAYLQIAEDAGLPVAGIQKESRAAYFRARTQPDSKIDSYVKDGVLIVDFGSSTIDFTYLNSILSKPIDDGCPCGASQVERTLLEYAMAKSSDYAMEQFAQLYSNKKNSIPYNQILYQFRVAKEQFYSNPLMRDFRLVLDFEDITSSDGSPISGSGSFKISRQKVNDVLNEYIEQIKQEVIKFKEELKGQPVVGVFLTGGASRMDFVRQIFMEIFNLDEAHCPSDDNPSVIVSQGVAHLSYADIKSKEKEDELKKIAQSAISKYDWNGNFTKIINQSIKAKIIDKAWSIMIRYKDGDIGEWMDLKDDKSPAGEYICMEGKSDGFVKVRNIRSLNKEIKSTFDGFVHYDFATACEASITSNIVESIISELKKALAAFEYTASTSNNLKISGLSASITSSGAKLLSSAFCDKDRIIYKAVDSCYLMMIDWNLYKDRWNKDRKQHYDYYREHFSEILSDYDWKQFCEKDIVISGIDKAKKQTQDYVNTMIEDYVSYAKLAKFFK